MDVGPASSAGRRTGKGALGDGGLDAGDGCWNCEQGDGADRPSSPSSIMVEVKCVAPFHSGTSAVFWDLYIKIHSEVNVGFSMV